MSEPKSKCRKCGTEILASTSGRTGGLCMPCFQGRPKAQAVKGDQAPVRWQSTSYAKQIFELCGRLIEGKIGIAEASRAISDIAATIWNGHGDAWIHPDFAAFVLVASATMELPIGPERTRWAFEALEAKDRELNSIEMRYKDAVLAAAKKLLKDGQEAGESDPTI